MWNWKGTSFPLELHQEATTGGPVVGLQTRRSDLDGLAAPFNVASIFLGKARLNPSYAKGAFGPFQSEILAIFREITARWAMSSTGTNHW